MIAQYIIDWKCVRDRIYRADDVALERLRGQLSALREKVVENGAVNIAKKQELDLDLNAYENAGYMISIDT